jgi:hypothetical protein
MEADGQEDRLDGLLSHRLSPSAEDADLLPLLETARILETMGQAVPRSRYLQSLDQDLTAKLASLSATRSGRTIQRNRRIFWVTAVAAALLAALIGVPVTASTAPPGSPLFAIRQVEVDVQVGLAPNQPAKAQVKLTFAQSILSTVESANATTDHTGYLQALSTFSRAYHDASASVAQVPASAEKNGLQLSLDTLRAQATTDLYASLATKSWADRVAISRVLQTLGTAVPTIDRVTYPHSSGNSTGKIIVRIHGAGFVSGAIVYVAGQPAGTVRKFSPSEMQVELDGGVTLAPGTRVGVSNPDGTAAEITLDRHNASTQGAPAPLPRAPDGRKTPDVGGANTGSQN